MKSFFNQIMQLPKWYGVIIVLIYSIFLAEFSSTLNEKLMYGVNITGLLKTFMHLQFGLMILSGMVVWIILCLLFHLSALLFDGKEKFKNFLVAAAYPYIFIAIIVFIAIILLDNLNITASNNIMQEFKSNNQFKFIIELVNYAFIPYYFIVVLIIHYLYKLKYLYSVLSVFIPVFSVWGVTELFKLI